MYLPTLQPYRKPGSIRNEIDNLLHEFFGGAIHTGPLAGEWLPPAEITETEDSVFVKAELPGIEEKDIELSISDNVLTIRGEKKHVKEDKGENHYFGDRYYGSFRRTFQLPADILGGLTLVIVPLLSLMTDQQRRLETLGIPADCLRGGQTATERRRLFNSYVPTY